MSPSIVDASSSNVCKTQAGLILVVSGHRIPCALQRKDATLHHCHMTHCHDNAFAKNIP